MKEGLKPLSNLKKLRLMRVMRYCDCSGPRLLAPSLACPVVGLPSSEAYNSLSLSLSLLSFHSPAPVRAEEHKVAAACHQQ